MAEKREPEPAGEREEGAEEGRAAAGKRGAGAEKEVEEAGSEAAEVLE